MPPAPAPWRLTPRALAYVVVAWLFTLGVAAMVTAVSLVVPRRKLHTVRPWMLRFWGRNMLRLSGARLLVEGAERLDSEAPRIVTYNHASVLDAYCICALMPPGGTATFKRELLFYPLIGLAAWLAGLVPIDRGHSARAHRTLAEAAERMHREALAVFIAPEGTRTRDGKLRVFKKGTFHLALATRAPIVPIVIEGTRALQPRGRWWPLPGVIRARVLPPIDTHDLTREGISKAAEDLRALYVRELEGRTPPNAPPTPQPRNQGTSSTIFP